MSSPVPARPRGRPAVGERVAVRLPSEVLQHVDARAAAQGQSRAAVIRSLLVDALSAPRVDGVDRAQILRLRSLTPLERIRRMANVATAQRRFRGSARTAKR